MFTIEQLFLKMIENPRSIPVYRELITYYESVGMKQEADAFRILLVNEFNSFPDDED